MANLEILFQRAESQFGLKREIPKKGTMEVLKFEGRGVAWRWLGLETLQLCPPMAGRKTFRDGHFLVIKDLNSECRYKDSTGILTEKWSYTGCDCTGLPNEQVWDWIETACEYQKRK